MIVHLCLVQYKSGIGIRIGRLKKRMSAIGVFRTWGDPYFAKCELENKLINWVFISSPIFRIIYKYKELLRGMVKTIPHIGVETLGYFF